MSYDDIILYNTIESYVPEEPTGGAQIINCANNGEISGQTAGGLAAKIDYGHLIHNSYNTGAILYSGELDSKSVEQQSSSDISISGAAVGLLGGLVGRADSGTDISNCYNAYEIANTDDSVVAGGLIGTAISGYGMSNCYYPETGIDAVGYVETDIKRETQSEVGTLATFTADGSLTALEGNEIIGGETILINALNTWVRQQDAEQYSYWGALPTVNSGYPGFIDAVTVSFAANGGTTDAAAMTKRPGLTYGRDETGVGADLPVASRIGYDYAGWKARTDTVYKVEHYRQKSINGSEYILNETKTHQGTTDTKTEAVAVDYNGYEENTSHSKRVASGRHNRSSSQGQSKS